MLKTIPLPQKLSSNLLSNARGFTAPEARKTTFQKMRKIAKNSIIFVFTFCSTITYSR